MVWQPEIEELKYRESLAEQMGGKEGVERQHTAGKFTVRERIAKLVDPGTFQEIGKLAGSARYEGDKLVGFTPSNTVIGICEIEGRKVVLSGGDFTVRGGAADAAVGNKSAYAEKTALEWKLPYIRLLDATGGSVRTFEQIGRTYIPGGPGANHAPLLLNTVPVVSIVLGSVAGLPAVQACLAHFNIMVKKTTQVFVAGPPVVKAALGYDIPKEELGSEEVAVNSGVIDNVAESEDEAFNLVRRFLSYLPRNIDEIPQRTKSSDDPHRREEKLLSVIPRDKKKGYNPYQILKWVMDQDSFFEITPGYGRSRVTGLARLDGYPVGVMINNPMFLGGSMDVTAGNKVIRFLMLCDTFNLPIVYFADEPGFMVGLEAEKQGTLRVGARASCVTALTRMPWISIVIRQLYGVAGGLSFRSGGMFRRIAWPSANWGSMHIEGGTMAAYRREISAAPDPEAKRVEIERRLQAIASPYRTAEAFNIEDIIDPRDTRPFLCDFIATAQSVIESQMGERSTLIYLP
ncbi:MAG: carboxyl transferase domain-containing protein [Dehalococcoidia bacterium]|nr:carboxyl transferase domain-containing protein [Dehalococcoidia bacterium]